jgi:hypothetical protein
MSSLKGILSNSNNKRKGGLRSAKALCSMLLAISSLLVAPSSAMKECEGVTFAPVEMVVTRAKDQQATFGEAKSTEKLGLVDMHTFNHFYSF